MEKSITTFSWISGLCLAGAETDYFIINVLGALIFLGACIFLGVSFGEESVKND